MHARVYLETRKPPTNCEHYSVTWSCSAFVRYSFDASAVRATPVPPIGGIQHGVMAEAIIAGLQPRRCSCPPRGIQPYSAPGSMTAAAASWWDAASRRSRWRGSAGATALQARRSAGLLHRCRRRSVTPLCLLLVDGSGLEVHLLNLPLADRSQQTRVERHRQLDLHVAPHTVTVSRHSC